jgi:MFS family permease
MSMAPRQSLDWLNFFLADVRGGMGAYVNVYLFAYAGWDQQTLGSVLTVSGLIGITLHAPIGALIDRTRSKRGLIIASVVALAFAALAIAFWPTVPVVLAADILMAILGAVFAPTVAAITVGMVGREELARWLGRNAAFDRAGNLFIAAVVGLLGTYVAPQAPFFLVPLFASLTFIVMRGVDPAMIDHARARGLEGAQTDRPGERVPWRRLLTYRPLVTLATAVALFHFANAPLLPLIGQRFALDHPGAELGLTSIAIVVSQVATIAAALLVPWADAYGRKPLLVLACLSLPVRALLCAFSSDPVVIGAVQLLDGLGGGLLDALLPLLLADIMRGSGHYSAARGITGFLQGVGGSSSQVVAGTLVLHAGYPATFQVFSIIAVIPLLLAVLAIPETRPKSSEERSPGV